MIRNNHIVCDLRKAVYAKHYYENQHQHRYRLQPKYPTVFGERIFSDKHTVAVQGDKSTYAETELEAAKRLGILDVWFPVTRIQFANCHAIEYTGEKAQSIWKAWNERIFNQKQKK